MGGLTRNKFLWVSLAAALVAAVSILVTLKDVGEIPEWVEGFIVSTAVQQSQHFGPNDEDHLRKVCWVLTAGALFFIALLVFAWNEFRSHSRCRVALEEERRRASQVDSTHTDFLRQLDKEAERIRSKLDLFKSYRSIISDCTDLTILEDGTCDVTYIHTPAACARLTSQFT